MSAKNHPNDKEKQPAAGAPPGRPVAQGEPGNQLVQVSGAWDVLVRLFARASPVSMSHWNPGTGECFELPRGKQRAATAARFEQRLWQDERWVEIPCQESADGYQQAVAFTAQLRPGKACQQLQRALAGPKPFRGFRAVLQAHPGLQRRWQDGVEAEAELRLAEFCLAQGWRLADPRFDVAVEKWLDATEPEEDDHGHAGQLHTGPWQMPGAATLRSMATLSLGRRAAAASLAAAMAPDDPEAP